MPDSHLPPRRRQETSSVVQPQGGGTVEKAKAVRDAGIPQDTPPVALIPTSATTERARRATACHMSENGRWPLERPVPEIRPPPGRPAARTRRVRSRGQPGVPGLRLPIGMHAVKPVPVGRPEGFPQARAARPSPEHNPPRNRQSRRSVGTCCQGAMFA